ncbi:hypothetical protein KRE47_16955 [Elizabethkingia meningoseptica]|uniref:hypothetical protein n=1 Tax=Elizabethkingia meningoseptica TaxID=238 RepID=UPI0022F1B2F8|nr:hypothetical protein [Elizabethkingia meningoseptica]EJK5330677.1 hypothetical protein [Elizabethkingia meningoseptica]MDE5468530.1 hypothetical protein [Elizabethkingia meningoseptica]MDE5475417.1 hypothetical protein [Elizabethkingia meningoseptica]MDE5480072.1 hypothetical protein [Elizabethkingia meningoseptica]MDE5487137.1 hypothetical protein [Elizabethkingia meningoseptica]
MKDLDKIFKDQLSQPKEPPAGAWDFIQSALDEKKKKNPVYIWLPISGVAALFLIGVFVINSKDQITAPEKQQSKGVIADQHDIFGKTEDKLNDEKEENSIAGHITKIKTKTIEWRKAIFDSQKSTDISEINKELIARYKNEISAGTTVIQPDKNKKDGIPERNNTQSGYVENNKPTETLTENKNVIVKRNEVKESIERFSLSAFFAPTKINAFGGKSLLSNEFNNRDIQNTINISYGARVNYAINDKVKIRTGVAMVDIEQKTKNVPLTVNTSPNAMAIYFSEFPASENPNIAYSGDLRVGNLDTKASNMPTGNFVSKNNVLQGELTQKIQYVEIPLEAEVKLTQFNKFGINATVGASSYMLTKNNIQAQTQGAPKQEFGTATNLNDVSFSANAGLKIDFEVSKKIKFNVEPNLKYMIKPMNKSENTQPYIIGISTGATFSF